MCSGPATPSANAERVRYELFAQAAIADLEELRLTALEDRIDADMALGRHADVVAELHGLTTEHPLRERLRGQLMLALYRCGRQADALDVYRLGRRRLVDELGIEPGPALHALERAILDQDPSLAAPPGRADAEAAAQEGDAGPWFTTGRKTVTVLFADLSVSLSAQDRSGADPEAMRPAVMQAYDIGVAVVERRGGTAEGFIGDVVVAVFGIQWRMRTTRYVPYAPRSSSASTWRW